MTNPLTTYRIQFHKDFTFQHLEQILPYLQKLGVTTVYASPIFEAVPGSVHGYDATNPNKINPEIGTENQLRELSKKLKEYGMLWLQDIVPNHMAYDAHNEWLMDVLEKGEQSLYYSFFDINWKSDLYNGKVMVPFLGNPLNDVLKNGELKLAYENGRLVLKYYDNFYPINYKSYLPIFDQKEYMNHATAPLSESLKQIIKINDNQELSSKWSEFLQQFSKLMNSDAKDVVYGIIGNINNDQKKLKKIITEQVYQLCHWQETDYQINYRRFFTVNGLICLNIQNKDVMQQHHQLVKKLVDENIFQGLRIDHIDGLYDPTAYLGELRKLAGEEAYITVEKILEPNEGLPTYWSLQGNTGYDFLAIVNNLFTNKNSEKGFTSFYYQLTKDRTSIEEQIRTKKSHILYQHMAGELENLYRLFVRLKLIEKKYLAGVHPDDLKTVIGEFLIHFPVYRFYGNYFPLSNEEASGVQDILNRIKKSESQQAVSILEKVFLQNPSQGDDDYNQKVAQFYQRCMQFTGPLMAKGVEDTLMYTYNRFIGHNEVGDSPEAFGFTTDEFHRQMIARQQQWPLSLNGTSTHDTKRGEDVRARLNVLTDLSEEWFEAVKEWRKLNKDLKQNGAPNANDEYLIYQALVGSWPMHGEDEDNFAERFQQYLEKALREAKTHSNWTTPNQDYEAATKKFAVALLDRSKPFWNSFEAFQQKIVDHGIVNSLSQTILKFTCPGTSDIYQGCELWDFSLVDPDNRRPVDYEKRQTFLNDVVDKESEQVFTELWSKRYNGEIKLWLTHLLCNLRKESQQLFSEGEYLPLSIDGAYKDHVLAFARKRGQNVFIVAVPLHTAQICKEQQKDIFEIDWKDTRIILPKEIDSNIGNVITGVEFQKGKNLKVNDYFKQWPFIFLKAQQKIASNERGAGILLHITSLPSPFGIGDLGPEAKAFADFLKRTKQKYWQMLPLNPTEAGQGHSPYSSISSSAGHWLLISPELLAKDGLLDGNELQSYYLPKEAHANYAEAEKKKAELLDKAYENFKAKDDDDKESFRQFCEQQKDWLDDFAFYSLLKKLNGGKPWYEWSDELKLRDGNTLQKLSAEHGGELQKIKWQQFIFFKQWKDLKAYCNSRNIQLIGDMPIYVSYDSVDVWAHREIFAIDERGNRIGLAGVPPDAFSADGQLWGMPVFKWDVLKEQDYKWWVERIKRNRQLFDIIRLDHFRAFAEYWEVPAGETTAKNGEWKAGPASDFFNAVEKQLGELPFVAEDLGEVDDKVLSLRDEFHLPGMKVLQFAFGDDMPHSDYIPHNYTGNFVAYTGTHDNNTTKGWFKNEADDKMKNRIRQYLGRDVSENDVSHLMCRLAYGSVAKIAILPMQDILNLDENSRMNTPASGENNWGWRLVPGQLNIDAEKRLQEWVWLFNRE